MLFVPGNASQDVVDTYTKALDEIFVRDDFWAIAREELGVYPQQTGNAAQAAFRLGTQVKPEAREFVVNWLKENYGVVLE